MAEEKRGTLAVLALVFGIVGFVISWIPIINYLGFALSVAAVVVGAIELTRISKGNSSSSGRGFSIAGMVLGAIAIVSGVIFSVLLAQIIGGIWSAFV